MEAQMTNLLEHMARCWRMVALIAIATMPLVAAPLDQATDRSARVALYASVGEELIGYREDLERATLTRQSSVILPCVVQEAWASPSKGFLYVAWSNGGTSYNGSGVAAHGDKHGVTTFRIDAFGALHVLGAAAPL